MNQYTNLHHLEHLHHEAAQHNTLELLRAQDRTSLRAALEQVVAIARRWTLGNAPVNARNARGAA